jgi:thiol:disulfide interchange protein DsbD
MKLRAILTFVLACTSAAFAQFSLKEEQVKASLLADTTAIVPGRPFTALVRLEMKEGWHVYWEFGGDSGLPPKVNWALPEGFRAGPITWPLPEIYVDAEIDQTTYVYHGELVLPITITPPAEIAANEITLSAALSWLVCEKICVPGQGNVSLTLPVAREAAPANVELLAKVQARLPKADAPPFRATWEVQADVFTVRVSGLAAEAKIEFFPLPPDGGVVPDVAQITEADGERLITVKVKSGGTPQTSWRGLLVAQLGGGPREGWMLSAQTDAAVVPIATEARQTESRGFMAWLGFAFVGGMILNLMPCVLPVIALKIFGFVQQAGQDPRRVFRLGLAFVAGVFVFFLALAAVAIVLGRNFFWGMQFGDPRLLLALIALTLVFALAMFGVFEITLGGAESALGAAARKDGYGGAFTQGLFTTLLGTSCTAPFLGPVLGFAVAQPPAGVLAIFLAMAAGLSLPYFLLTWQPAWLRFLPKPGAWMERFKQLMGFVLLAVVMWLLGVFGHQRDAGAIAAAGWLLVIVALACWIYGTRGRSLGSLAFAGLLVGAGCAVFLPRAIVAREKADTSAQANALGVVWEPFTEERLAAARKAGQPVFIDFTAEWCANCKVIEATVINTAPVAEKMKAKGVVTLKADFTDFDPLIRTWLTKFDRIGVPLYVLYRPGEEQAIVLPDVPTPSGLLAELEKIAPR